MDLNYECEYVAEGCDDQSYPALDKTQNPKILTFKRLDGTTLTSFQVTEDSSSAARTKVG